MAKPYWYVRRLKVDEVGLLRSIQERAPHYYLRYPHHREWVEKCIKLIEQGERDAFGVFVLQHPEERQSDQPKYVHAGSVILKKTFGDSVELKNFLLNDDCFHQGDLDRVRAEVLEKAYIYCEKRGFGRIAIELSPGDDLLPIEEDVPQEAKQQERHLLTFLHEQGFRVASLVASRYRDGDFFYLLEKELEPRYYGDPFDFVDMVQWILRYRFPAFKFEGGEYGLRSRQLGTYPDAVNVFTQTLRLAFPHSSLSEEIVDKATIRLQTVMYPEGAPLLMPANLYSDEASVRFLFANVSASQIAGLGASAGVVVFSREDIDDILGGSSCDASQIYFGKDEIGGLVVSVPPEQFTDLQRLESADKKLAFFLWWGGFGRFAGNEGDRDFSNFIVFDFPIPPVDSSGGTCKGFYVAELEACRREKPEILWEDYCDIPKLIDKHDYLRFSRHIDAPADAEVIGLVCRNLTYIDADSTFLGIVESVDGIRARDFYGDRMNASGVMTTYISSNVAEKLDELLKVNQARVDGAASGSKKMDKKHVFISYQRKDKSEVFQLVKDLQAAGERVWWDELILGGRDWKEAIREAMKNAYAVVVCLSPALTDSYRSGIYPELRDAIATFREYGPGHSYLFPVRLAECDVPPIEIDDTRTIERIQRIDLFPENNRDAALQKLLESLAAAPEHP